MMADRSIPALQGTIGDLEARAGIGPTHEERFAFWHQFSHLHMGSFDAGRAELRRLIEEREGTTEPKGRKRGQRNG